MGVAALSTSGDGTVRIWNIANTQEVARFVSAPGGEWLTMTPEGFFSGSHRDTDMLAIVRGLEVTTIGQVHQSLFNPDLVREALAGDPDGEVKRAAEVITSKRFSTLGRRPPLPSPRTSPAAAPAKTLSPSPRASRIAAKASGASSGASTALPPAS